MARTRLSGIQVHDDDFYLQSEGDTLSGTLSARIDAKPDTLLELTDTPSSYDVDKYLKSTVSGTEWSTVSGTSSTGGGLQWTVISGSATASNGNGYLINASNNDVVLSLPSSPSEGDMVGFCDFYSAALANTITISGSGSNIFGSSEPLIVDVIGAAGTLVYSDATRGWELTTEVGSVTQTTFNYQNYVDRGDVSSFDWTVSDFTTDGTWRDLDCSAIVPSDAVAISFRIQIQDDAAGSTFRFRENGNSNTANAVAMRTQVANVTMEDNKVSFCDTNQVVEYFATNTTWTIISIVITGWYIEDDQTAVGSGNVYAPSDLTDNALIRGDGGAKNVQTSTVVVSDDGEMTNPSQPSFCLKLTADQTNIATGSYVSITWDDEVFDVGNNCSTGVFTAPVTGKYLLSTTTTIGTIDTAATSYILKIYTSNRSYAYFIHPKYTADLYMGFTISVVADMDANDTAKVQLYQNGGTQQSDIYSGVYSCYSGALIS